MTEDHEGRCIASHRYRRRPAPPAAQDDTMTIGITQNNVGVDSYQTTYEQAFIAAAEQTRTSRPSCWMPAATSPARSRRCRT